MLCYHYYIPKKSEFNIILFIKSEIEDKGEECGGTH